MQTREQITSLRIYGPVSADLLTGTRLPYVENLVNLLVVDDPDQVPMIVSGKMEKEFLATRTQHQGLLEQAPWYIARIANETLTILTPNE